MRHESNTFKVKWGHKKAIWEYKNRFSDVLIAIASGNRTKKERVQKSIFNLSYEWELGSEPFSRLFECSFDLRLYVHVLIEDFLICFIGDTQHSRKQFKLVFEIFYNFSDLISSHFDERRTNKLFNFRSRLAREHVYHWGKCWLTKKTLFSFLQINFEWDFYKIEFLFFESAEFRV